MRPMPAPRKQWFDKLADAILGDDDDGTVGVSASRYALICQKCFAHNGLVKESMWEDSRTFVSSLPPPRDTNELIDRVCMPEVRTLQPIRASGAGGAVEVWLAGSTRRFLVIFANAAAATDESTRGTEWCS